MRLFGTSELQASSRHAGASHAIETAVPPAGLLPGPACRWFSCIHADHWMAFLAQLTKGAPSAGQASRSRTSAAQRQQERRQAVSCQAAENDGVSRRELLLASSAAAGLSQLQLPGTAAAKVVSKDWQQVCPHLLGTLVHQSMLSVLRTRPGILQAARAGGSKLNAATEGTGFTPHRKMECLLQVKLPLDPGVVLLDIAFTETDPNRGETGVPPAYTVMQSSKCTSVQRAPLPCLSALSLI